MSIKKKIAEELVKRMQGGDSLAMDYASRMQHEAQQEGLYRMQHRAPRIADDFSGDNLGDAFPDIYTHGKQYYSEGRSFDGKALDVINGMKGSPEKEVTMFRAVPNDVNKINEGDWVTTTREYAEDHAAGEDGWKILEKKVKAKDLANDGNSIHEFGYKALGAGSAVGAGMLSPQEAMAQAMNDRLYGIGGPLENKIEGVNSTLLATLGDFLEDADRRTKGSPANLLIPTGFAEWARKGGHGDAGLSDAFWAVADLK